MTQITVLRSTVSKPAGKNYEVCDLSYKTDEGKTKGMKILSFLQPDVFSVAVKAASTDVLEASFKQSDKGFWNFNTLEATGQKAAEAPTGAAKASAPARSNFETSDERAARQVLIVRQSSLSSAVAFLAYTGGKSPTKEQVVDVAKHFEAYVFDKLAKDVE